MGDREEEDYYYYCEMEAKRKQKNPIIKFLELPIQYIFGYGTKEKYILITWFLVVFSYVFFFWISNGVEGVVETIGAIIRSVLVTFIATVPIMILIGKYRR